MRKGMAWLAAMGLAMAFAGCNGSTGAGADLTTASSADVQGKWYLKSMHEKGSVHMVTQAIGTAPAKDTTKNIDTTRTYNDQTNFMQFNADGTFVTSEPGPVEGTISSSGTWKLDGKTMTLTQTAPTQSVSTSTVGLDGSNLVSVTQIDTTYSFGSYGTETLHMTMTVTASK